MIENKRFTINLEYDCIDDAKEELFIDFNDRIDFNKLCEVLNNLYDENEQLKKENYKLHKRLGDFEPFEEHIKERTSKTSVNDIIGLVKTDEPTNSVELKKELYK